MSNLGNDADPSPVKPTVIDLDPEDVTVDAEPGDKREPDSAKAQESAGETPPSSSTTPARDTTSSYRTAAFVAALGIGVVAGGWAYRDLISSYFPSDNVKALAERVDILGKGHEEIASKVQGLERLTTQLTSDVNELEASATATATSSKTLADDIAATKASLASLQSAIDETKTAVAAISTQPAAPAGGAASSAGVPADVAARLAALEQDVAALKAQKTGEVDKTALTQTVSDLKAKIEAGTAFADEADRIARLLPAASGLDVIAAHAAQGLPNAKGLATELSALKPDLPTPEVKIVPSEPGIWDRIGEMLSSVITIRDLDAVNWQQVADKAIAFAEAGDLPQAVAAVDEPEATIPPKLQQWRDRAAARLSLETALASVTSAAERVQNASP